MRESGPAVDVEPARLVGTARALLPLTAQAPTAVSESPGVGVGGGLCPAAPGGRERVSGGVCAASARRLSLIIDNDNDNVDAWADYRSFRKICRAPLCVKK